MRRIVVGFVVVCIAFGGSWGQALAAPSDLDAIFAPVEPPIDVTVMEDESRRVSAELPLEGGSLEVVGADGTVFQLEVPDGALTIPTWVGIAPLDRVDGIPFGDGVTYAVRLEPSGLTLLRPAILTIEPAAPLSVGEQIPIGFEGTGAGLFLAEPVVDDPAIAIAISHFSGYGVTKGLLADTEPYRQRLGGDAERRINSQLAAALAAERQRQLLGDNSGPADLADDFAQAFERFDREVVAPRVAAAGESCANARLAITTVLGVERQRQLLGGEGEVTGSGLSELLPIAARVCVREEYEICRDEHTIGRMIPVVLSLIRQSALLGAEDPGLDEEVKGYARRCLTFRLEFESEVTTGDRGVSVEPSVRASVKLEFDPDALRISGTATQEMSRFKVKVPRCRVRPHPHESTFEVMSLAWTIEPRLWDTRQVRVTDFVLGYRPGDPGESVTMRCPPAPQSLDVQLSMWFPAYVITHKDEWSVGSATSVHVRALAQGFDDLFPTGLEVPDSFTGEFKAAGWEVQEARLLGRRPSQRQAMGGKVKELGSMELFHEPG